MNTIDNSKAHIRYLKISTLVILLGSMILGLTNLALPIIMPIVSLLLGIAVVRAIYFLPGRISWFRDLLMISVLIAIALVTMLVVYVGCWFQSNLSVCLPNQFRASLVGGLIFSSACFVAVSVWLRITQLWLLIKGK